MSIFGSFLHLHWPSFAAIDPLFEVPDTETPIERFLKYAGGVGRVDSQRLVFTRGLSTVLSSPLITDVTFSVLLDIIRHIPLVCEPMEAEVRCCMLAQLPLIATAVVEATEVEAGSSDSRESVLRRSFERLCEHVLPAFRTALHDDLRLVRAAAADCLIAACHDVVAHMFKPFSSSASPGLAVSVPLASPSHSEPPSPLAAVALGGSKSRRTSDRLAPATAACERPYQRVYEACPDGYSALCNNVMSIIEELGANEVHWHRSLVPKIMAGVMPFLLGDTDNRSQFASACLSQIRSIAQDDSEVVRAELARSLAGIWCPPVLLGVQPWESLEKQLRDTVQKLAIDYDANVRKCLATVLPALASHSKPVALMQYLGEVFCNLLTDEEDRVAVAAGGGLGALVCLLSYFADVEICANEIKSPDTPPGVHKHVRHASDFGSKNNSTGSAAVLLRSISDPGIGSRRVKHSLPLWHMRHILAGPVAIPAAATCTTAPHSFHPSLESELKLLLSGNNTANSTNRSLETAEAIIHARRIYGSYGAVFRVLLAQLVAFAHGNVIGEHSGTRDTIMETPLYTDADADVLASPPILADKPEDEEETDEAEETDAFDIDEIIQHKPADDGLFDTEGSPSSNDDIDTQSLTDIAEADFEDEFSVGDVRNRRIEHAARAIPGFCLSLVSLAENLATMQTGSIALHVFRELCHRLALALCCIRRVSLSADPNGKATVTLLSSLPDIMTCARFVSQTLHASAESFQFVPSSTRSDPKPGVPVVLTEMQQLEMQSTLRLVDDLALDKLNIELLTNALARSGDVSRQYAVTTAVRLMRELPAAHYPAILRALLGACGLETFMPSDAAEQKEANSPGPAHSHGWHNHLLLLTKLPELAGTVSSEMLCTVIVPLLQHFLRDDIAAVRHTAADACVHVLGALILRFHESEFLPASEAAVSLLSAGERKSMALHQAATAEALEGLLASESARSRGETFSMRSKLRNALKAILADVLSLGQSSSTHHHERSTFIRLCRHVMPDRVPEASPLSELDFAGVQDDIPEETPKVEIDVDIASSAVQVHRQHKHAPRASMIRRLSTLDINPHPAKIVHLPPTSPQAAADPSTPPPLAAVDSSHSFEYSPFVAVATLLLADLQPEKETIDRRYEIAAYWRRRSDMVQLCNIIVKDMALENDVTKCVAAPEYFCCRTRTQLPARVFATLSLSPHVLPAQGMSMAEYFEALKQKKIVGLPPDLDSPFYTASECATAARTLYRSHLHAILLRQLMHVKPDTFSWKEIEQLVGEVATKSARYHWAPRLRAIEAERAARAATVKRLQELAPPVNTADLVIHHLPAWPPPSISSNNNRSSSNPSSDSLGFSLGDIASMAMVATSFEENDNESGNGSEISSPPPMHRRSRR
jgi:hypothetical protein